MNDDKKDQTLGGRYRFERFIARGGMGEVWEAIDTQLGSRVALKVMASNISASAELLVRFEREARAAAQIRSPHVARGLGHGVENGRPFVVMELLEGEDLRARIKRRGRLSLSETVTVVLGVCKALRRAHEIGIVHRDLKPANIFFARQDEEEIVKVLDFGIAKLTEPDGGASVTATGAMLGTAHYMAPEQARFGARAVDHRADLWSVGVIAFRALTGKLPFTGSTLEVIQSVFNTDAPAPSAIAADLGPEVDRLFARALTRDRAARFQSADEMAAAFQALSAPRAPALDRRVEERPALTSATAATTIVMPPPRAPAPAPPPAPAGASAFAQGTTLRRPSSDPPVSRAPVSPAPASPERGSPAPAQRAQVLESPSHPGWPPVGAVETVIMLNAPRRAAPSPLPAALGAAPPAPAQATAPLPPQRRRLQLITAPLKLIPGAMAPASATGGPPGTAIRAPLDLPAQQRATPLHVTGGQLAPTGPVSMGRLSPASRRSRRVVAEGVLIGASLALLIVIGILGVLHTTRGSAAPLRSFGSPAHAQPR